MEFPYRLYLVVSDLACKGKNILHVVESAVRGGVDLVQFRDNEMDETDFAMTTNALQHILIKYNVPLIVNDRWDIAKGLNAYGVHVGKSDNSPGLIKQAWPDCSCVGYSIEYEEQINSEEAKKADYLGICPVFTKTNSLMEWGIEGIRWIRSQTNKPLAAIGNINMANVKEVVKAGVNCIAVMSSICSAKDPEKAAAMLRNEIEIANLA
jgi:thiamine-phosphate pyrophosphorylase